MGPFRHLLGIEALNPVSLTALLNLADAGAPANGLLGRRVFISPGASRTLAAYRNAAQRLGATLSAQGQADICVIRSPQPGVPAALARIARAAVINAGDGAHAHPTRALADALTISRAMGRLSGLTVAIVGDIAASAIARSNILLLTMMSNFVRLIGPPPLIPAGIETPGVSVHHDMASGLAGADVVILLRPPAPPRTPSAREFAAFYKMARPDALVLRGEAEPLEDICMAILASR